MKFTILFTLLPLLAIAAPTLEPQAHQLGPAITNPHQVELALGEEIKFDIAPSHSYEKREIKETFYVDLFDKNYMWVNILDTVTGISRWEHRVMLTVGGPSYSSAAPSASASKSAVKSSSSSAAKSSSSSAAKSSSASAVKSSSASVSSAKPIISASVGVSISLGASASKSSSSAAKSSSASAIKASSASASAVKPTVSASIGVSVGVSASKSSSSAVKPSSSASASKSSVASSASSKAAVSSSKPAASSTSSKAAVSSSKAPVSSSKAVVSSTSSVARPSSSVSKSASSSAPVASASASVGISLGVSAADAAQFVTLHNNFRAKYSAGAVTWDDSLAAYALRTAQTCKYGHTGGPNGENIAAGVGGGYNIEKAFNSWANEDVLYDFTKPGYSSATGHFTQIVWKGTTKIGCAAASCADGTIFSGYKANSTYVVCEYQTPGNIVSSNPLRTVELFTTNVGVKVSL